MGNVCMKCICSFTVAQIKQVQHNNNWGQSWHHECVFKWLFSVFDAHCDPSWAFPLHFTALLRYNSSGAALVEWLSNPSDLNRDVGELGNIQSEAADCDSCWQEASWATLIKHWWCWRHLRDVIELFISRLLSQLMVFVTVNLIIKPIGKPREPAHLPVLSLNIHDVLVW